MGLKRSYYSAPLGRFLAEGADDILGMMAREHEFPLDENQRDAWAAEIRIMKRELRGMDGHVLLEYTIPRMGKRVDAVLICRNTVFVIEFKAGSAAYVREDVDQCVDYALDLKNFHHESHGAAILPVLVATEAPDERGAFVQHHDGVFEPVLANGRNLGAVVRAAAGSFWGASRIEPGDWEASKYSPTPTIIEAARALYADHRVEEISRSEGAAKNLTRTARALGRIIRNSKANKKKSICFVTGVPGAGKTLAGLNLATGRRGADGAVFLSGNGPLVDVLQEALARDRVGDPRKPKIRKGEALRSTRAFIQKVHHFRDAELEGRSPPAERVAIFDEAQRAWTREKLEDFMKRKKGRPGFGMSEPQFLVGVLDRHPDWAVIVCLVGEGQEIHDGEAGISEWFSVMDEHYPDWDVYVPEELGGRRPGHAAESDLHLATSIRSFRGERVSEFVGALLGLDRGSAAGALESLGRYPIAVTRDFELAKRWVAERARGSERYGIVASAKSYRLQPHGIYVELTLNPAKWFLNSRADPHSSYSLEYAATEFDVQGLELDWACVAWDADLRHDGRGWQHRRFRGAAWTEIRKPERQEHLKNAYRVLLTRARQGMVIFVPEGDEHDATRSPEFYDRTYEYLRGVGIEELA